MSFITIVLDTQTVHASSLVLSVEFRFALPAGLPSLCRARVSSEKSPTVVRFFKRRLRETTRSMATRVACTAAPRACLPPTPRLRRERPSRARREPVCVVAGDFPLDNETIAPPEAETLDAFVTRVCQRVGRGEEEARAIARTLRANWFETAEDVVSLTVDQLVAMGVPARWGQAMCDLSREETDAARLASGEATTSGAASARTRSEDGWIGGPLPGPDERLERPTTGRTAVLARAWGSDRMVSAGASGTRERASAGAAVALSSVRVTKRKRLPPYALRDGEVPETLRAELEKMRRDVTTRRVGGGRAPVRRTTAANYEEVARGLMGWLARVKRGGWDGVTPLETGENTRLGSPIVTSEHAPASLSLLDAIPSGDAEGASLAVEYLQWLCEARGIAASTEAFQLRSLIAIAKWLHPPDVATEDKTFEKPVVMELVRVQRGGKTLAAKGAHVADESAKWLDWPAYLALVETLRRECAPLTHLGDQRSDSDVACAVQRYLLFAILACVPDRQRTLRELRLGKTLVCETFDEVADGLDAASASEYVPRRRWVVRHNPEDYKTGNAYGARPDLALDPRLYPALEQWLFGVDFDFARDALDADIAVAGYSDWGHRAALAPTHDFVFCRPNGSPWTVSELSRTFSRASLRLTGKKTNPHLVRDMVVTHVRSAGVATDAELEALAMYMGHSVAMQKGTYDRRTTQQKVAPAVGLMSTINVGHAGEKKTRGDR